jgi:hypothetical protein
MIVRIRGRFGLGVVADWRLRVLSVHLGWWELEIEGPQ